MFSEARYIRLVDMLKNWHTQNAGDRRAVWGSTCNGTSRCQIDDLNDDVLIWLPGVLVCLLV
jgi:hypothetical protein